MFLKRENSLVIRSNLARNFLERQSANVPHTRGLTHDFLPCPLRDQARIIPVRLHLTNAQNSLRTSLRMSIHFTRFSLRPRRLTLTKIYLSAPSPIKNKLFQRIYCVFKVHHTLTLAPISSKLSLKNGLQAHATVTRQKQSSNIHILNVNRLKARPF